MIGFLWNIISKRLGLDKVVKDKQKISLAIGATFGALIGYYTQFYGLEPHFAVVVTGVILLPFFYVEAKHGLIGEEILFAAVSALFGAVVGGLTGSAVNIITGALAGIGLSNVATYIIGKAGIQSESS
ncbi:MAG: hypothetical protein AAF629_07645 [Chloroflexota bacterium]